MAFFKERLFCPVCNTHLGDRFKDELFVGHCAECKASFIWKMKVSKPEARLDPPPSKRCTCGNCKG